ncbi:hypothetical protein A3I41_01090 [Candidatus Uhrbacteria bacterium RIFCSPLOWO2_02_FULL_48_18]|uniref:Uncharacterized protein n=1 Tax=Candidatus Uhrbacteria bacterium RIFCSPLOWO2_02_FULL_48_18 TaxID=1802408 RepID=A0A1F7V8L4_9BACT|nr:MAG: hypothetical protein A2839_04135 [Candidatus Uhrbacteria bacterium RIFCSPHIGHO2_01_FULL_47_10]OGL82276.1 MAG: hypothetical protein A3B20_00800 [Candidatus Uhrbacteria bacterium RIFCSPLOWO2_01_FULL_47_17]OGL86856.1 MAG: hypothetical protein A3I41_01090 [Candidatus Uhrbacteria bacterium RIFCSPLOWO2_02_FULL_48_18]OGL94128.1 MAG: hypothetical protein A3H12_00880 [Candidatus Uhrbacteria bacterium RIFCSPLOWO2_12_FULL_47_9]
MRLTRDQVIGICAWVAMVSIIAFVLPSFVSLYAQSEKQKPLPLERLSVDNELTLFHEPAPHPSCWYELHDLQGKSGTRRFPIECQMFHRMKKRLDVKPCPEVPPRATPSKKQPEKTLSQKFELANTFF